MSTGVLTVHPVEEQPGMIISVPGTEQVPVEVRYGDGDTESSVWRQVDEVLRKSIERSGSRQLGTPLEGTSPPPRTRMHLLLVAPGVMVSDDEYKQRYDGINLQQFRQQMPPSLFKVFVRHIGSIRGHANLDVNEITTIPE